MNDVNKNLVLRSTTISVHSEIHDYTVYKKHGLQPLHHGGSTGT